MIFPLKDQDWSMDDEKEGSARNQSDPPTKGTSKVRPMGANTMALCILHWAHILFLGDEKWL